MTAAPTYRRVGLLRLTWPLLVVTVITLLAALGNTVILSQASPELNAAVATANQVLGVLYDLSVLFAIGALVVVAQLLGAGAADRARRAVVVALRASAVLGAAIAVFVAVGAPVLVDLVNTPAEIADDAVAYLWVVAGGMFFNAYIVAATAVLRAYGRTPLILVLGIVVNVFDVLMLATFVLVLDLGAAGAALPSLLIRGVGAALLAWFVKRSTGVSPVTRLPRAERGGSTGSGRMARLSLPSVLENGAYNLVIVAVVSFINVLGTDAINARSYTLTLTALVTGVILALSQGNETIVGWEVGEDARRRTRDRTLRTVVWTAVTAAALAALLWAVADVALSMFGASAQVVEAARGLLALSIVLLPLSAASGVLFGALRSAGDVWAPMAYSIAASALVLLPVSWWLVVVGDRGLTGAWWALIAAEAVKAGLLLRRWLGGRWATIPSVAETGAAHASRVSSTETNMSEPDEPA